MEKEIHGFSQVVRTTSDADAFGLIHKLKLYCNRLQGLLAKVDNNDKATWEYLISKASQTDGAIAVARQHTLAHKPKPIFLY